MYLLGCDWMAKIFALFSIGIDPERTSAVLVDIVLKLLRVVARMRRWMDLNLVWHHLALVASAHTGVAYRSIGSTIPFNSFFRIFRLGPQVNFEYLRSSIIFLLQQLCLSSICSLHFSFWSRMTPKYLTQDFGVMTTSLTMIVRLDSVLCFLEKVISSVFCAEKVR